MDRKEKKTKYRNEIIIEVERISDEKKNYNILIYFYRITGCL